MNNSYRDGIEIVYRSDNRRLFDLKREEIARASVLCKKEISPVYLKKALKRADVVILAHDVYKNDIRGSLRGFATLQMDKYPGFVYLDVICRGTSTGMNFRGKPRAAPGRSMIDAIKSVARRTNSQGIVLTALESVIGYYTRLGFRAVRSRKRMRQIDCPGYRTENDQDRNIYNDITAEGDTTFMRWCARRAGV